MWLASNNSLIMKRSAEVVKQIRGKTGIPNLDGDDTDWADQGGFCLKNQASSPSCLLANLALPEAKQHRPRIWRMRLIFTNYRYRNYANKNPRESTKSVKSAVYRSVLYWRRQ
jgi:hypothetical protein